MAIQLLLPRSVLVSESYCQKLPKIRRLDTREINSLRVLGSRSMEPRWNQGQALYKSSREEALASSSFYRPPDIPLLGTPSLQFLTPSSKALFLYSDYPLHNKDITPQV